MTIGTVSLSGADASNYVVGSAGTTTANITQLLISGTVTVLNKVFDGTTTATIDTRTLNGVLGTDIVSYVGGTAQFDTPAVGINKTVTVTGLSLSGADAGNYQVNTTATTTANITVGPLQGPKVISVQVNGADTYLNNNQRSQITSVIVNFDTAVTLDPGAIRIVNANTNVAIPATGLLITPNSVSSTSFTIRFASGPGVITRLHAASNGNSLEDGNYRLEVDASKVQSAGGNMSSNYAFGTQAIDNFFRLFGDSDGDGDVDGIDMLALRTAQRTAYNAALDADGDGQTVADTQDMAEYTKNRNAVRKPL